MLNVAPTNSDVFHPNTFQGTTHVSEPERDAVTTLLATGLVDVDVVKWGPGARRFTWWNHGIGYSRNLGMRIDMLATDQQLANRLDTTWIDHVERAAPSPSDHASPYRRLPSRHTRLGTTPPCVTAHVCRCGSSVPTGPPFRTLLARGISPRGSWAPPSAS